MNAFLTGFRLGKLMRELLETEEAQTVYTKLVVWRLTRSVGA